MRTKERIRLHEGVFYVPTRDSEGHLTIGIGRNMETTPFSEEEVELMFTNDYWRAYYAAQKLPGFENLNEARQGVLIEMVFQMGLHGVRSFKRFIAAYRVGHYEMAKAELLDSRWHRQTTERCEELAHIFFTGEYGA